MLRLVPLPKKQVLRPRESSPAWLWPLAVSPLENESFPSWLRATASTYQVTVRTVMKALGMPLRHQNYLFIGANISKRAEQISDVLGVPLAWAENARQERTDPLWNQVSHQMGFRDQRPSIASKFCPECLADSGGRWKATWFSPLNFACVTHQRLLHELCPRCGAKPFKSMTWLWTALAGTRCLGRVKVGRKSARCPAHLDQLPPLQIAADDFDRILTWQRIVDQARQQLTATAGQSCASAKKSSAQEFTMVNSLGQDIEPVDYVDACLWLLHTIGAIRLHTGGVTSESKLFQRLLIVTELLSQPSADAASELAFSRYLSLTGRISFTLDGHRTGPINRHARALRNAVLSPEPIPALPDPGMDVLRARRTTPAALWASESRRYGPLTHYRLHRIALSAALVKISTNYSWSKIGGYLHIPYRDSQRLAEFWHEAKCRGELYRALALLEELRCSLQLDEPPINYARRRETFEHPSLLRLVIAETADETTRAAFTEQHLIHLWAWVTGGDPAYPPTSYRVSPTAKLIQTPYESLLSTATLTQVGEVLTERFPFLTDEPLDWQPPPPTSFSPQGF